MKVRKSDIAADPSYPDAKEFVRNRGVLGAAMVGAGMMLGGCNEPRRTSGVPQRTGGVVAAPSAQEMEKPAPRIPKTPEKSSGGGSGEVPRLPGKVKAEPEPPARLLGDVMVVPRSDPQKPDSPPMLGGVAPVVPTNSEH